MKKLSKLKLTSKLGSNELKVIRGGKVVTAGFEGGATVAAACKCSDCCGTCDAISMSGRSAGIFAGSHGSSYY